MWERRRRRRGKGKKILVFWSVVSDSAVKTPLTVFSPGFSLNLEEGRRGGDQCTCRNSTTRCFFFLSHGSLKIVHKNQAKMRRGWRRKLSQDRNFASLPLLLVPLLPPPSSPYLHGKSLTCLSLVLHLTTSGYSRFPQLPSSIMAQIVLILLSLHCLRTWYS